MTDGCIHIIIFQVYWQLLFVLFLLFPFLFIFLTLIDKSFGVDPKRRSTSGATDGIIGRSRQRIRRASTSKSPPLHSMKLLLTAAASFIVAAEGAAFSAPLQNALQSVLGLASTQQPSKPPNFLFMISDDQDLQLDSVSYTPLIQKHLRGKGISFRNHFVTTSLCCPSRVSLWTGRQAHNTNVTDVRPPYGE